MLEMTRLSLVSIQSKSCGLNAVWGYVRFFTILWLISTAQAIAKCGNGILEGLEECDCGPVGDCRDPCCRALVCTLKEGAQCSNLEPCCRDCKFKPKWEVCRGSENECDLPEYCTGKDFTCPPNIYRKNGYNCSHDKGYCFNGQCQTHQQQCNLRFDDRLVTPATEQCYVRANKGGTEQGNCGGKKNRACQESDALCGSLQCIEAVAENIGSNLPFDLSRANDSNNNNNNKEGLETLNCPLVGSIPPLVLDYTKCGSGKICLHQKCVNLTSIPGSGSKSKCPGKEEECSGQGDCSSLLTCQCHRGWQGRNCSEPEVVTELKSPASTVKTGIIHDIPVTRSEDEGPITHKHAGEDDTNYTLGMVFAVAVVSVSITFFICALVYCYLFSSPISKAKESLDSQGDDYSMDTTHSNQQIHPLRSKETTSVQNMEVTVAVQELVNGQANPILEGAGDQSKDNGSCPVAPTDGPVSCKVTSSEKDPMKVVGSNTIQAVSSVVEAESRNGGCGVTNNTR